MKSKLLLCLPILFATSIACNSNARLSGNVNATTPDEVVKIAPDGTTGNTPSIHTNPDITGNGFTVNGTPATAGSPNRVPTNVNPAINPIPQNPYVIKNGFNDLGQPNQNPGQNAITGISFTPNQNPVADVIYNSNQGVWVDANNNKVPTDITGHDQFGNPIPGISVDNQGSWTGSKGNTIPGIVTGYNKNGHPTFDIPYVSNNNNKGGTVIIPNVPNQNVPNQNVPNQNIPNQNIPNVPNVPNQNIPNVPNQNIPNVPNQNIPNQNVPNPSLSPSQNSGSSFSPSQNSSK